jgi:hypothetical protein
MTRTGKPNLGGVWIGLAALTLLGGCGPEHQQDSAEREFNAWANQVEQDNQANGSVDFEEPSNILARVVPRNGQ